MKTAQYTKSLTVSLRPEVFDQIKQITDERQISIGQWVRDAVDSALEKVKQKKAIMNEIYIYFSEFEIKTALISSRRLQQS